MKQAWIVLGLLAVTQTAMEADKPTPLQILEARYDTSKFAANENLREKYVHELTVLRFQAIRDKSDAWKQVDAEIEKYPAPAKTDSAILNKLRAGKWESSRHDYLYRTDGTWVMDPNDHSFPLSQHTHGTWSIKGNHYTVGYAPSGAESYNYTIILLDDKIFIFTESTAAGGQTSLYFERRAGTNWPPLRRGE